MFDIELELLPEYEDIRDYFEDRTADDVIENVESGKWQWFTAKVTASKGGIELAETYLGACVYESAEDFIQNSGYYEGMVAEVTEAATKKIKELAENI